MISPHFSLSDVLIRLLKKDDVMYSHLWAQHASRMQNYYSQQEQGRRLVFVATYRECIVGYVSLHFISDDPVFSSRDIPEIVDLNVSQPYHNRGIGAALIKACEEKARDIGWTIIGIGVELEPEYAAAQHLYPKLGYMPIEDVSQKDIWSLYKRLLQTDLMC